MALEDVVQGVQVSVKTDGVDDAKDKIGQLDKAVGDLAKTAENASGSRGGGGSGGGSGIGGLNKAFSDLNTVSAQAFASIARSAVSGDLTGLATLMGGPVAGSFVETAKAISQFIDTQDAAILKNAAMAKQMGTTPGVIQGLREGFEGAGVSAMGFERLVNRMSRQVQTDYTEMTRNIRTDSDTQEGALLRVQAAQEKLAISKGADPASFVYQDKIREQKQAQIALDQAEEGVRQQALKSIPHVTELLNDAMQTGRANNDLTEVSSKTLRQSIEHLAQTGEGPADPINVLKTEFDLIKGGAIDADKAVELLKEQMGSMRSAGLGGMDAQHLFDYAKTHGAAGIEAAQSGATVVKQLGLGQTAADTQKATETVSEWSKFTSLFGAVLQKIGASFSGKDSVLDATLRGGENAIGFFSDLHRRLQAASDAATGSTIAERAKNWWNSFQNPPKPGEETPEKKGTPVPGGGGVTVENVGTGPAKIYHVPEGFNGPPPVTRLTRTSIGSGPGSIIQVPPGFGEPDDGQTRPHWRPPTGPPPAFVPPLPDKATPEQIQRWGGGAAPPVTPISDGGIVSALQNIASRITSVEFPTTIGQGVSRDGASAVAPIPKWQGGTIRVPGFAGGGTVEGGYDYSGNMGEQSQMQMSAEEAAHPDTHDENGQLLVWDVVQHKYAPEDRPTGNILFSDTYHRRWMGGMIPGFAEGGPAAFSNLGPMSGLMEDGVAVGSELWEKVKSKAPNSVGEARTMAMNFLRGHITGAALEKTAIRGLETVGIFGAKAAVGTTLGVFSNPFGVGLLDTGATAAADYNAGARQEEEDARARGAKNLREAAALGMWSGGIPGFAMGSIKGPGTGTSDSILARVSNGEFVMKDAAVRTYGEGFMHAINNMQIPPPKYAYGGMVPSSSLPRFAEGGGVERPGSILNLTIGNETFHDLKVPAAVADQLKKYAIGQQTTSTGRKPTWAGG